MTNKRISQFEKDRQKMLTAIGMGEDEPEIAVEEKAKEEAPNEADPFFQEKLQRLKEDSPSPEEYESRALKAMNDEFAFDDSIRDKSPEEAKKARQRRRNKQKRIRQRYEKLGPADGFGTLIQCIDNFYATFGGGVVYMLSLTFVFFPIGLHWYLKENWLCAILAFGVTAVAGRVLFMWLSYIAWVIMKAVIELGPQFLCEIREGRPATKLIVSLVNTVWWIARNAYIGTFLVVMVMSIWILDWSGNNWIDSYLYTLLWSMGLAGVVLLSHSLIGFAIYAGTINAVLKSDSTVKYRLRYLFDQDRIMIPTRSGPLVSREARVKAFSEAYTGVA